MCSSDLGDFPAIEMAELLGLYESSAMQEEVFNAVREDEIRMIREQFGAEVISYIYYPDQFIFSKTPLRTLEDFDGLKIRTHSTALGDLAAGLGASGQFVAFSEVYTALERGVLDRSEEHTSELQSRTNLVCRLLLEKKKQK